MKVPSLIVAWSAALCLTWTGRAMAADIPGLLVTVKAGAGSEVVVVPNFWWRVQEGGAASPFAVAGPFTATWEGFLAVDLRGEYAFAAELSGTLKLEINGETILNGPGAGTEPLPLSPLVRLNKGKNAVKATFASPAQGAAWLRILWQPKGSFLQPIPSSALSRADSPGLASSDTLRRGRELWAEHRCGRCHTSPSPVAEFAMDGPALDDIGDRRRPGWMARWILNPAAVRPAASMPSLLHGDLPAEEARAMAAYLASLKSGKTPAPALVGSAETGQKLAETLHCGACHNLPGTAETDPAKISLDRVAAKFFPGGVAQFLEQPSAHYAWIRMPRFKLDPLQRAHLEAYLTAKVGEPDSFTPDFALVEKGRQGVQAAGCLNCHALKLANSFKTRSLAELTPERLSGGCLADVPTGKAPRYAIVPEDRAALRAFLGTDRAALARHVPAEQADRAVRQLNCNGCHGKVEGLPPLEIMGDKLKPEWMQRFIAGGVDYKPRPWLEAQMPAFSKRADGLALGLAAQHGHPPVTPVEPAIDAAAAQVGLKLVSAPPLGFSCVSCHSVGSFTATEVFEAPGINFIRTGERVRTDYVRRWIRNPTLIDPSSKMPVYFDEEGRSPITDYYDGNGAKQINALWDYLRLGDKMPLPKQAGAQ